MEDDYCDDCGEELWTDCRCFDDDDYEPDDDYCGDGPEFDPCGADF